MVLIEERRARMTDFSAHKCLKAILISTLVGIFSSSSSSSCKVYPSYCICFRIAACFFFCALKTSLRPNI